VTDGGRVGNIVSSDNWTWLGSEEGDSIVWND
jgi:hypothetical protein